MDFTICYLGDFLKTVSFLAVFSVLLPLHTS